MGQPDNGTEVEAMNEKERLFEKISRLPSLVDMGVIIEDLSLLDADMEWWPRDIRRRVLAEGLEKRKFFATREQALEAVELWMQAKEMFGLRQVHHARLLISEYNSYLERLRSEPTVKSS